MVGAAIGTLAVGFHGGAALPGINNVYAFTTGKPGHLLLGAANSPDPGMMPALSELRAFVPSGDGSFLFVANGSKDRNQVLRFTRGSAGEPAWVFLDVYASDGLSHPFDVVVGFGGDLFVSNQDTNTVTRHAAPGPATTFVEGFKEVRGLAYDGTHLYVADVGGDTVGVYDGSGTCVGTLDVKRPVHLLLATSGWLWIGSERGKVASSAERSGKDDDEHHDAVYAYDTVDAPSGNVAKVVHGHSTGLDHTAGLCLIPGTKSGSATLLVASRVGRQVLAFPIDLSHHTPSWNPQSSTTVLGCDVLSDNPEFIALADSL
jgi:DNA-binding beta-propeller fold protein YncE